MIPEATPEHVLRNVEQGLLGFLELHQDQDILPLDRRYLLHWARLVASARVASEDPAPPGAWMLAYALLGAALALVGCVLYGH